MVGCGGEDQVTRRATRVASSSTLQLATAGSGSLRDTGTSSAAHLEGTVSATGASSAAGAWAAAGTRQGSRQLVAPAAAQQGAPSGGGSDQFRCIHLGAAPPC
jgi:hypothetical protein